MVSIIVPTYNRCGSLGEALRSLREISDYDSLVTEIIVVDNNSTDNTRQMVAAISSELSPKIKYLFEPFQGKSFALNKGIREARGDLLAFIDDDEIVDREWLKNHLACLRDYKADLVAGRVLPRFSPGCPRWIQENPTKVAGGVLIYDYGEAVRKIDTTMYLPGGGNFIMKRQVVRDCGMFRTDLGPGQKTVGEDTEFMTRVFRAEKGFFYCGRAVVWHPVDPQRLKLSHIARWHIQLGTYFARVESEDNSKRFVYWLGIPRYLIRGILNDLAHLLMNCFNKLGFFNAWRGFFCKWGMIQEYRRIRKQQRKKNA